MSEKPKWLPSEAMFVIPRAAQRNEESRFLALNRGASTPLSLHTLAGSKLQHDIIHFSDIL